MKKILILGAFFLLLLIAALTLTHHKKAPPNTSQNINFPNSVSTSSGNTYSFLQSSDTKEDPNNPGTYYLGNQPSPDHSSNPPYSIAYDVQTKYFNITLFQEPIGQQRTAAEQYLQKKLGITQQQMCSLNYIVGVPDWVNSQYSDSNLEFSFCPGAVQLPN